MADNSLPPFNTQNPPPARLMKAHLWGGIAAACITAGVVAAVLFTDSLVFALAPIVWSIMAAIGPAIAFFHYQRRLPFTQSFLDITLKDGRILTFVYEYHADEDLKKLIHGSPQTALNEHIFNHGDPETSDKNKLREWAEYAVAGYVNENRIPIFRIRLTSIATEEPPAPPTGGIIIGI